MTTETMDLPAGLTAVDIKREIVEAYVRDLAPIRADLEAALADSDLDDLYAPIWAKFGSAEAAAAIRAIAEAVEANNRRLLAYLRSGNQGK